MCECLLVCVHQWYWWIGGSDRGGNGSACLLALSTYIILIRANSLLFQSHLPLVDACVCAPVLGVWPCSQPVPSPPVLRRVFGGGRAENRTQRARIE